MTFSLAPVANRRRRFAMGRMEMDNGQEIAEQARSWLGTRFHHQGRLKRSESHAGGCDCLGLLIGVAQELDLKVNDEPIAQFDECDYGHFPDSGRMRRVFERLFSLVLLKEVKEGDILLLNIDHAPQHLAIVSNHSQGGLGMIHALASARKIVEHRLDEAWEKRITAIFRLP